MSSKKCSQSFTQQDLSIDVVIVSFYGEVEGYIPLFVVKSCSRCWVSHAEERRLAAPSELSQHSLLYSSVLTTTETLTEAVWQVTKQGWETSVGVFKMVLAIVIHVLYPHCIYELFQNICRFAPVLLLPRYIVATRSISLRSQNGCTVL